MRIIDRSLPVLLVALSVGCASSPPPAAPAPTPTPTKTATDTLLEELGVKKPPAVEDEETLRERKRWNPDPVTDPVTGQRLQPVPKALPYVARDGKVFNTRLNLPGFPIIKEDDQYWYIAAVEPKLKSPEERKKEEEEANLPPIIDIPASEAEVITPRISKIRLHLKEMSEGLPVSGQWRRNFVLADLLGDGHLEIASPPPRLSSPVLRVFKLEGEKWVQLQVQVDDPQKRAAFSYGGLAAADMDGDGKIDLAFTGHGVSPFVLLNRGVNNGGLRFEVRRDGIPDGMSSQALDLGDLVGDGHPDILAISDTPEWAETKGREKVQPNGYIKGYDTRAFLSDGTAFHTLTSGLEGSCFGYTIALWTPPKGSDADPFIVSSCRYMMMAAILHEFDRKTLTFRLAAVDLVERYAGHLGSAVGTYRGFPAAYTTWFRNTPSGASRDVAGAGVTLYWREGKEWKKKRVVKWLDKQGVTEALAVGDLNGDGLDDVVFADENLGRLRILFQTKDGDFEELDPKLEPKLEKGHPSCIRIGDVTGEGRNDIVVVSEYLTGDPSRAGGFRYFRNLR